MNKYLKIFEQIIDQRPHQGICPDGWHIPGPDEAENLPAWFKSLYM